MTPLGTYVEVDLTIENRGRRNSIVTRFDLNIAELGDFPDMMPQPRNYVQTRNINFAVAQTFITRNDKLLVPANNFAQGLLPIYLEKAPADEIQDLHITLTIVDTDNMTASGEFVLTRQGA